MNENTIKPINKEGAKRKISGESKAHLLAVRKQQAEELALLKGDNFSLEDELHDIKKTLLVDANTKPIKININNETNTSINNKEIDEEKNLVQNETDVVNLEVNVVKEEQELKTLIEEEKTVQVPKQVKPLTEAQKQALKEKELARIVKAKEREKEKARLAREKEKEKAKLLREKEKAKEKARLLREKEKAKEKAKLLREKEKAKEKARLLKEKEKAKQLQTKTQSNTTKPTKSSQTKVKKDVDKNIELNNETLNSIREESTMKDSTLKKDTKELKIEETNLSKDKSTNEKEIEEKDSAKGFFVGKEVKSQFRVENDVVVKVEEKDSEGKVIIDNLQKLREQIMAQKKLERELMEKEAIKTQQKDKNLLSKLSQIEQQVIEEQSQALDEDFKTIEAINIKLEKDLNQANKRLNSLLGLSYNGINIIENDKLNLNLVNEIFNEASLTYRSELKQIEAEASLLIKEHNDFVNHRDIDKDLSLLTNEIEDLNAKLIESKSSIEIIKSNALKSQEAKFNQEKLILESNYETKLQEEINKVRDEVTSSLEAKHLEELKQLSLSYKEQLNEKIGNNDQYLSRLSEDRNNHLIEVNNLQKQIESLNHSNLEQKQLIETKDVEIVSYTSQIDDLKKQLETQLDINHNLKEDNEKYNDEISKLQKEISDQSKFVESYLIDLEEKFNLQQSQLKTQIEDQKTLLNTYANEINAKNSEIISLKTQLNNYNIDVENKASEKVSELKNEIQIIRTIYDNRLNNIGLQLSEANTLIKDLKLQIAKDAIEFEKLRKEIEEERKSNLNLTQKLYNDIDSKDKEIYRLNDVVNKAPIENNTAKLENQIQAISLLVNELNNKAKQPFYSSINPIMYPPYYPQDTFNMSVSEYEKELLKRTKNDEQKPKDEKDALEVNNEFAEKINSLEIQIKELGDILRKLPIQDNQLAKDEVQAEIAKNIATEIEKYKQEVKDLSFVKEELVSDKVTLTNDSDIDLISYKYHNILNKLEVSKKFAASAEEIKIIDEKIKSLNYEYSMILKDRNIECPVKDSDEVIYNPEVDIDTNQKVYDDSSLIEPEDKDAPIEIIEDVNDDISDTEEKELEEIVEANNIIEDSNNSVSDEDSPTYQNNETVIVKKNSVDNSDFRFSGSIDQNYINRLNNIRRLKNTLENKKKEQDILYNSDLAKNDLDQKEYLQKIEILKNKLFELEKDFKNEKNNSNERKSIFETDKTKLHLELQARQEQLRKLQEDVQRKLDLRYKNTILNIDEQIATLNDEENELKDSYLLKKQKMLSKINREKEMLEKLEQEKASKVEDITPRIIESQEEKKHRLLKLTPYTKPGENVLDNPNEDEDLEKVSFSKDDEVKQEISDKEKKLALLYDKYIKAEAIMVNDISEVNTYKNIRLDLIGLELEYNKQKSLETEFQTMLSKKPDDEDIKTKIHDLDIRIDNLLAKIDYRKKQIKPLLENKNVQDYVKITKKLEQMKELLIKYEQKRNKNE